MSDQKIRILIETVFNKKGTDEAIAAEKELQNLASKGQSKQIEEATKYEKWKRSLPEPVFRDSSTPDPSIPRHQDTPARSGAPVNPSEVTITKWGKTQEQIENEKSERKRAIEDMAIHREKERERLRLMTMSGQQDAHVQAKKAWEDAQAKPPPLPDEQQGFGSQARRAIGSVVGRAIGIPSLGTAFGIGGAAGVAVGAVQALQQAFAKLVGIVKEWLNESQKAADIAREYKTVEQHIDGISLAYGKMRRQHEMFLFDLGKVQEQVNSLGALVSHMGALNGVQQQYVSLLDQAVLQANLEQNLLQNHFNILGKIRGEHELIANAKKLAFQREREADARKLELYDKTAKMADEEIAKDKEKVDLSIKQSGEANRAAQREEHQAQTTVKSLDAKSERAEDEAKIMQQIKDGRSVPLLTAMKYGYQKGRQFFAGDSMGKDPIRDASIVFSDSFPAWVPGLHNAFRVANALGGNTPDRKISEIDKQKENIKSQMDSAINRAADQRTAADLKAAEVKYQQSRLQQHTTQKEEAIRDKGFFQEEINLKVPFQEKILKENLNQLETNKQNRILDTGRKTRGNPDVGSIGDMRSLLEKIEENTRSLAQIG